VAAVLMVFMISPWVGWGSHYMPCNSCGEKP
jgi:hypothetical protein